MCEFHLTLGATLLDWLLGLSRLSWSDNRGELGWQFELPAWAWALIVLASVVLAGWSYARLAGPTVLRTACAAARAMLLLLVAAFIAGPTLTVARDEVEPDWLLMLVDRSASLQIRDVLDKDTGQWISREQSLWAALASQAALFESDQLGRDRRLIWLGFGADTFDIEPPERGRGTRSPANRPATSIRTAIEQALQRAAGRPISAVVLFTDGRSPQNTGAELVRRVQRQAVGVFTVPLGSAERSLDLAIGRVDAPEKAMVNDIVPVTVVLERYPPDSQVDSSRVRVQLIDAQTNELLDERRPDGSAFERRRPIHLSGSSAVAGAVTWRVEVRYDDVPGTAADPLDRERIIDNNTQTISLELVDRPIRVLYVETYPRWEYRYLKNLLIREQSILSSIWLVSADPSFAQEGDVPIHRLPASSEELESYDVLMIGDVASSYFTVEQVEMLRDHVAARAAGLIWIGGSLATPRTYEATPLADLLPMRRPGLVQRLEPSDGPVTMQPAPLAAMLHVLQLRSDVGRFSAANSGLFWPQQLSPLLWAQNLGRLKPAAEILALAPLEGGQRMLPLVVRLRYGAGQSIYVATDETWRWRLGRGDLYYDQFWMQLVQLLARGRLQQRPQGMWLDVSHRRVEPDQAMVIRLRIDNQQLLERNLPSIAVAMSEADNPKRGVLDRIELLPAQATNSNGRDDDEFSSHMGGEAREYQAIWQPGDYQPAQDGNAVNLLQLRVVEPALIDQDIIELVELVSPADELRHPAADHDRLERLAADTGGRVVPLGQLSQLAEQVPNRARRTAKDISESLLGSPLSLFLVVFLLTVEWIGRKVMRLA